jgi:serine/threonine-protein kinase HipA
MNNTPPNLQVCPGTLQAGHDTYSRRCIKEVFGGVRVPHVLDFPSTTLSGAGQDLYLNHVRRISISGVQQKYLLRQEGKKMVPAEKGSTHILKPIPQGVLACREEAPANEHLTMQIAQQVFGIPTAANALIFFSDGQPAFITKRFDVQQNGGRCLCEDFASLAGLTPQTGGHDYKYNYSYLEMCRLIDMYFPAAIHTKEVFFRLIVFNYLFSNGDAHLKNFSRLDCTGNNNAFLAPAYDLLNTALHNPADTYLALEKGLYEGDMDGPGYSRYGCYCYDDFLLFAEKAGLMPARAARMLEGLLLHEEQVSGLISNSFLSAAARQQYMAGYRQRRAMLAQRVG